MKDNKKLSKELYKVAREKSTEAPYSGKYADSHEKGMFKCAICGTELFSSDTKFDSGSRFIFETSCGHSNTKPVISSISDAPSFILR